MNINVVNICATVLAFCNSKYHLVMFLKNQSLFFWLDEEIDLSKRKCLGLVAEYKSLVWDPI